MTENERLKKQNEELIAIIADLRKDGYVPSTEVKVVDTSKKYYNSGEEIMIGDEVTYALGTYVVSSFSKKYVRLDPLPLKGYWQSTVSPKSLTLIRRQGDASAAA